MNAMQKRLAVALGHHPADLAVRNARVFNVFTGAFEARDILVADGRIAALYPARSENSARARVVEDAEERFLLPGFIDAHLHLESSKVRPLEYCSLAAANGVTTLVADPHEICNVLGLDGLRYMLEATENAPVRVFFLLPSCVPASPLESAARTLTASDLVAFLGHPRILGMGEMMNYPGVLTGAPDVLEKITCVRRYNERCFGPLQGLTVDGHAPRVLGADLQAYAASGIRSDHEASTPEEAFQRLGLGMALFMREGSAAKNLLDLVPAVTPHTEHLCALCTDDRNLQDLIEQGSINSMARLLARDGRIPLAGIVRMAAYNAARHFGLEGTGAAAPGFRADFALYPDLSDFRPDAVWCNGRCVSREGKALPPEGGSNDNALRKSVKISDSFSLESFAIADKDAEVKVIELVPGQIVTGSFITRMPSRDGLLLPDPGRDIAKLAVIERHGNTGNVGLGFVRGMGMARGALASSVAHDSHNLVALGMSDEDMFAAVQALRGSGGGLAACLNGRVLDVLPLPLAGLFSDLPAQEVYAASLQLKETIRALGCTGDEDPFMALSFLSLPVIPSCKLTDLGLVDVEAFILTSLYVE